MCLIDCRTATLIAQYALAADPEALQWDPFLPFQTYSALENGSVIALDVRVTDRLCRSFQAHDETVSSISFSSTVAGMLATASIDKTVKIWDVHNHNNTKDNNQIIKSNQHNNDINDIMNEPHCVAYKTMNVGKLFALEYYISEGFTLACGGDKGMVAIWESDELEIIQNYFQSRIQSPLVVSSHMNNVEVNNNNNNNNNINGDDNNDLSINISNILDNNNANDAMVNNDVKKKKKKKKGGKPLIANKTV